MSPAAARARVLAGARLAGGAEVTAFGPLQGQLDTSTGLQIVPDLTQIARQFKPHGFVYDQLTAPMQVSHRFGKFPVFNPAQYFAAPGNLQVSDRAVTPSVDFEWSTEPYEAFPYRLQTVITREEANQARPELRLDYSKTIGLLTQFASAREKRLAEKLRAEGNGGALALSMTTTKKWDTGTKASEASIQTDIQKAIREVYKKTGIRPNTIVLTLSMAYAIANDFTLKEIIKYLVGTSIISEPINAMLPSTLFGLKVVVTEGVLYNERRPGDPAKLTDTWGNSARVLYVDPNAQWGMPSVVYSFRAPVTEGAHEPPSSIMPKAGAEPGPAAGWAVVDQWWDYDPPALHIRAWESVDERVAAPTLGIEIEEVLENP
jgi:hypothetical protein